MPKRYLTGGGVRPKNRCKSCGYFSKFFNLAKIKKVRNLYQKLTFGAYDRIGGVEPRAARCDTWTRLFRKIFCKNGMPIQKSGSRTQEVPGASVFGLFIYQTVCRKIKKIDLDAQSNLLNRCTGKISDATSRCRGSILIEFAICMPILIILLFYIHDLVKIKRWYSQTEFAAQQFANIIQNISQKRENKRIKNDDLRYACYLSHLSIYPGTMMLNNGIGYGFAHRQELFITYVVGNSDGTASCKWTVHLPTGGATSPKTYEIAKSTKESTIASLIKFKSNVVPSEIYPSLKINSSGEEKIIIESTIMFRPSFARYDGYKPGSAKKAFGYLLLNPKPETKASTAEAQEWHYHSVVIFKPKPGLFSPDPPTSS